MQDLLNSLPSALRGFAVNEDARKAVVMVAWYRAVGSGLRPHTAPVALEGRRLTVAVRSEMWKMQIADLAGQILFKLNEAIGSSMVSYIDLFVDAEFVQRPDRPTKWTKNDANWRSLVEDELTPELETAAGKIEDEKLRQLFINASTSNLARQKLDLNMTVDGPSV